MSMQPPLTIQGITGYNEYEGYIATQQSATALCHVFGDQAPQVIVDLTRSIAGQDVVTDEYVRMFLATEGVPDLTQRGLRITHVLAGLENALTQKEARSAVHVGAANILGGLALAYSPRGYPVPRRRGTNPCLWRRGEAYINGAREIVANYTGKRHAELFADINAQLSTVPFEANPAVWGVDERKRSIRPLLAGMLVMAMDSMPTERLRYAPPAPELEEVVPNDAVSGLELAVHGYADYSGVEALSNKIAALPWLAGRDAGLQSVHVHDLVEDGRVLAHVVDLSALHMGLQRISADTRQMARSEARVRAAIAFGARRMLEPSGYVLPTVTGATTAIPYHSQRNGAGRSLRVYFAPLVATDDVPIVPLVAIADKHTECAVLSIFRPGVRVVKKGVEGRRRRH